MRRLQEHYNWSTAANELYVDYSLGTYLSHDDHQRNGADVRALATHVATRDDLESSLLSRVHIVGHILDLHDLLLDWMASLLNSQGVCEVRLGCLSGQYAAFSQS
jgi:hypothetical protein